jgi:hypothetical protein
MVINGFINCIATHFGIITDPVTEHCLRVICTVHCPDLIVPYSAGTEVEKVGTQF